jgi:dienelactone hydrolase
MVLDDYVAKVRQIREERAARLAAIRTRRQAEAYQAKARRTITRAFGPRPRKTALNPTITGIVDRPTHRVEKVLFESRPGCLVTGNLYVPKRLRGPAPGVVGSCGHSANGKLSDLYQGFCQRLVRNGFVVLIIDPFNQGERDQYHGLPNRESVSACTAAHNMMGKQLDLVGQWFGAWRAWDGVRALDYLISRPEVDPDRVGLTGNSGGGTMTTWIWAYEPRFTMAAPSCFVTTFLHNLENELPADCEQYPPGVIGAGLDMADFLIARAPNPILLLGQTYDYFDRRGLREVYGEVARFYEVMGAPTGNTGLFIGPQGHGYSRHNQEAMVSFFSRHAGKARVKRVPEIEDLGETLNVTPQGEVLPAGAVPITRFIAAEANRLAGKRKKATSTELKKHLTKLLTLPSNRPVPHHRNLRPQSGAGRTYARYAVETEGHIRAILRKRLETPHAFSLDVEREVRLYLPHVSAEDDLAADRLAISLQKKHPLYALDVRGLGESMPDDGGGDFFGSHRMDYMNNGYGLLLGQSYLGRRIHDTLSVIDLLRHEGARKVHLCGRGQGALIALFAAVLDGRIATVTLKNAPLSFHAWTQVPLVAWPHANFLSGALKHFDLPDFIRALGRKIRLVQPWGPDMKPLPPRALAAELKRTGLSRTLIKRA